MKRIRVVIEPPTGHSIIEFFDVADDTPEEDIDGEAFDMFSNHCTYGWSVALPDDDDYGDGDE